MVTTMWGGEGGYCFHNDSPAPSQSPELPRSGLSQTDPEAWSGLPFPLCESTPRIPHLVLRQPAARTLTSGCLRAPRWPPTRSFHAESVMPCHQQGPLGLGRGLATGDFSGRSRDNLTPRPLPGLLSQAGDPFSTGQPEGTAGVGLLLQPGQL